MGGGEGLTNEGLQGGGGWKKWSPDAHNPFPPETRWVLPCRAKAETSDIVTFFRLNGLFARRAMIDFSCASKRHQGVYWCPVIKSPAFLVYFLCFFLTFLKIHFLTILKNPCLILACSLLFPYLTIIFD